MRKEVIIIIGLSVALVITVQFLMLQEWTKENENKIEKISQDSYENGGIDAIVSLLSQTDDCNLSSITFKNFTRQVVDVSCIEDAP